MVEKKIMSKSSVNLYLQCPLKWKYIYVDKIPSIPAPAQERGSNIHKKIENFYKDMKPDEDLKHFIKFERKRLEGCHDVKYFYPLFQELKLQNEDIHLKGIIDAVFINPKDDGIIIIDWKTGHFNEKEMDNYRFELAVYKELLERSGKVDKIKYWAIYFTDHDKLFFEEVDEEWIDKMYIKVNMVRDKIERGDFTPKRNMYCRSCEFRKRCDLMKYVY